ncbi:putative group 3/4 sigma-70 RNA polymerase sigma factor [Calothrix sp. NIES-4071]|nr:putative group 3/4 sigma-70 RNA polymerase sigma factor [Calothrix sp. NIES-4071]BAZ55038.1 putative group 3/4 sigma-70 RNA polymerase sigma factor [Calothrix sp. NIES-4105]
MNKREDTIQKFSSFLSFQDKSHNKNLFWQNDLRLERRMRMLIESNLEAQPDTWARYFLKIAKGVEDTSKVYLSSAMAEKHLSAYLQEACFSAAQTLHKKFIFLRHSYSLEELFQMANTVANPSARLLKSFDFEYPYTNILSYAKTSIIRAVKNQIYQHDIEAKRSQFSDYALLKDLSNKELKECLILGGINQEQLNLYCLVFQCFDEIYQPTYGSSSSGFKKPNQKQLEEMFLFYNQRCNQLNLSTQISTLEDIQSILITCIQLAREYRTKRFFPLKYKEEENILDFRANPLDTAIEQEEKDRLYLLICKLFTKCSEVNQIMLKLRLGLNLTQTEIAMVLKNKYSQFQKQYQIARQLEKATKHLLSRFIQDWNEANPENLINTNNTELIKELLINCLQLHCKKKIFDIITQIKPQFFQDETLINANQNQSKVLSKRGFGESLELAFQYELESVMCLPNNSLSVIKNKLPKLIENFYSD